MTPSDFILNSEYDTFKNNNVFGGSFIISGSVGSGTSTRTYTVPLGKTPDMFDVYFLGRSASGNPRPSTAWFAQGRIEVPGTSFGFTQDFPFSLSARISGTDVIISATTINMSVDPFTLTPVTVQVRVVDYSIV